MPIDGCEIQLGLLGINRIQKPLKPVIDDAFQEFKDTQKVISVRGYQSYII